MSTRGAIARPHGDGWQGRYHHFDSYPSGLGKDLHDLYHGHFRGNLVEMQKVLIDEHPAGWSTLAGDWECEPGYDTAGPRCYCHGSRSEDPMNVLECRCPSDPSECDPLFIEWAYVLGEKGIGVYTSHGTSGEYHHRFVTHVPWNDLDVNWADVERTASPENYDSDFE